MRALGLIGQDQKKDDWITADDLSEIVEKCKITAVTIRVQAASDEMEAMLAVEQDQRLMVH